MTAISRGPSISVAQQGSARIDAHAELSELEDKKVVYGCGHVIQIGHQIIRHIREFRGIFPRCSARAVGSFAVLLHHNSL